MRYDAVKDKHHHLYDRDTGDIIDYFDEDLDNLLADYFRNKKISVFSVSHCTLHD